jgi:hypothetical protein
MAIDLSIVELSPPRLQFGGASAHTDPKAGLLAAGLLICVSDPASSADLACQAQKLLDRIAPAIAARPSPGRQVQ